MQTAVTPLTKEEMSRLMLEIEKTDEFDYMFFMTLKTTGRRVGELYGIEEVKVYKRKIVGKKTIYIDGKPVQVDRTIPKYKKTGKLIYGVKKKDLDLEKGLMKVWVLKRRQYIQDETILSPKMVRLLRGHINRNKLREEDYVFRTKGRSLRNLQNRLKKYAKEAGIEHPIKIHNFRHYFITELKRRGWTNDQIMKLTGHKTPAVLTIYDHIVADDIREKALETIEDI